MLVAFVASFTFSLLSVSASRDAGTSYAAIPAIIAINMILCGASGGILAVIIAVWAQVS